MGSIRKTVLTPIKWVSRKILHGTLLRFPGGDPHQPLVCAFCPEMCRFSCPTAVASGDDTVTPCNKMSLLYKENRWPGRVSADGPLWPLYQCTGCGRCTEYCVYQMPVADKLFAARQIHRHPAAAEIAAGLRDEEDLAGDLAQELGDLANAKRRLGNLIQSQPTLLQEPKAVFSARERGAKTVKLAWEEKLLDPLSSEAITLLSGKRWLIHESVWLSRRLDLASSVAAWIDQARKAGIQVEMPFQHGRDCIDCGGEGAYRLLFSETAARMAESVWERDQHRADGILCFSERCAKHFKTTLQGRVPVLWFGDTL